MTGMYMGQANWGRKGSFGSLGSPMANAQSRVSIKDDEDQRKKCKKIMYIALAVTIVLIVIISIALIVNMMNSKYYYTCAKQMKLLWAPVEFFEI